MTLHITEAELARDLHSVIEKVRQGAEVVIEQDRRPVAVIKPTQGSPRPTISEIAAAMEAGGSTAVIDAEFAADVEDAVRTYREPWTPPSLD